MEPRARPPAAPAVANSPFAPEERVFYAFLTSGGADRAGGGRRVWDGLWLDVSGDEPLPLVAYAHHLTTSHTPELDELGRRLPRRLRGDWHWSASTLARRTIKLSRPQ